MITYKEFNLEYIEQVKHIFEDEKWISYLKDDNKLVRAFKNSLYILGAFYDNKLIGFVRCVGDGEHIVLVQDLIVSKEYQKSGIGTCLFNTILTKYNNVRIIYVTTDINDEVANKFYKSFGMRRLEEGKMVSYFKYFDI